MDLGIDPRYARHPPLDPGSFTTDGTDHANFAGSEMAMPDFPNFRAPMTRVAVSEPI
jgi:hypothetical protein